VASMLRPGQAIQDALGGVVHERQCEVFATRLGHKRARRPISNDRELRDEFPFAIEGGMRREFNQQGDVFHVISEGAVRASIAGYGRIHELGPGVDATPQVVQIPEAFTQKILGGGLAADAVVALKHDGRVAIEAEQVAVTIRVAGLPAAGSDWRRSGG
jgi:hypothetical protein